MSSTADTDGIRPTATTDDLRRQAKVVRDDLRDLGRTVKEIAQDKLDEVRKKASEYVDEGKDKSAHYYEKGKHEAARIEEGVENYIRQNPLKSVLIATGAGVLLGLLLRRR